MATIGRSRAVAWIYNRVPLTGYVAWIAWLFLHLLWLLGFRNRISVLVNWFWNYFQYQQTYLILGMSRSRASDGYRVSQLAHSGDVSDDGYLPTSGLEGQRQSQVE